MDIQDQRILARRIEVVRLDDEDLHLNSIGAGYPDRFRRADVNLVHEGDVEMRKLARRRGFAVSKVDAVNLRRFANATLDVEQTLFGWIKLGSVNRFIVEEPGDLFRGKVETKDGVLSFYR